MNTINAKIHKIYSILLSIFIIISGICLIVSCVNIYKSGDEPFSRETVSNAFSLIAIPIYICLILTIIGFIIDFLFKENEEKVKNVKSYNYILNIFYKKRDILNCDEKLANDIKTQKSKRKQLTLIRIIILIICSAVFLIYSLNPSNFHQSNINDSMIKAMYVLLPCLIIGFICSLYTIIEAEKSLQTEIELLKKAPLKKDNDDKADRIASNKLTLTVRYVVLAFGIILLIYGFLAGGTADVLTKAINICTECIGLG